MALPVSQARAACHFGVILVLEYLTLGTKMSNEMHRSLRHLSEVILEPSPRILAQLTHATALAKPQHALTERTRATALTKPQHALTELTHATALTKGRTQVHQSLGAIGGQKMQSMQQNNGSPDKGAVSTATAGQRSIYIYIYIYIYVQRE